MTEPAACASGTTSTWPRLLAHKTARPAGGGSPALRAARSVGPAPVTGPAASVRTAMQNRSGSATYLRCGGCGTATVFIQHERRYGRLVHDFLDQHDQCGNAVEISAVWQPAGEPPTMSRWHLMEGNEPLIEEEDGSRASRPPAAGPTPSAA